QVNVASLRLFLRSSTGPIRAFEPQSLGHVRDPADFGFSILDFGLRTEATRVSLPEAPARGEGFLVNSLHEGERTGWPLLPPCRSLQADVLPFMRVCSTNCSVSSSMDRPGRPRGEWT